MAHRQRSPSLPGTLDRPDAGFMAAVGAYVAAVLVAVSIALAVAMGASTAAIVGSLSSAITVGLVAGGVAAGRVRGLPERLGRNVRGMALPFVVPLLFAAVTVLTVAVPSAPIALAFGASFGTVITLFAALVIASMARTRYARAVTPEEPVATVSLLKPSRDRRWIGFGLVSLALAGPALSIGDGYDGYRVSLMLGAMGVYAIWYGLAIRASLGGSDDGRLSRYLETDWFENAIDAEWLPTLEVHGAGLIVRRPAQRRFVPWERVGDVRLTDAELRIERPRRRDIRCARAVIDDPKRVREEIKRARDGPGRARTAEEVA